MVIQRSTRQMPVAEQLRRAAELDALRLQRQLTEAEQAEADNLADRAYHRHWRAMQREQGARIVSNLAARMTPLSSRINGPRNHGGAA